MTLTMKPTRHFEFATSLSYTDARLSSLLPDSFAPGGGYAKGTRLPGASEWMIANSLNFNFEDMKLKPRLGITHRYLSKAPVAFGAALQKGDYHIIDLNASVKQDILMVEEPPTAVSRSTKAASVWP